VALAGVAVLTAGCGTQVAGGPSQADTLTAAVTRTAAQTTRVAATITMQMQSMSFSYTATGMFDFAHSRGSLSMQQPIGMTELFVPPNVYVKFSAAGGPTLPKGKTWLVISGGMLGGTGAEGGMLGEFSPFGGSADPADLLKSLTGIAGSVKKVGTATMRGVAVTEYQVNIDPAKAAARLPSSQRASFRQFAAALGSGAIPVHVWVDGLNLVRRIQVSLHLPADSGAPAGARLTESTDFYDFGVPVPVAAPPASQVASISQIAGSTGKNVIVSGVSSGSGGPNPPKVTGTLTHAQADAAEQAVAAFWTALGRNDPAAVAATVPPSQRSCARSGLGGGGGGPRVTVSGFRAVSAEPAGDGRATVRFTVNATVSLGGQKIPLPSTGSGPRWLVAVESAGHWYVDLSASTDFPFDSCSLCGAVSAEKLVDEDRAQPLLVPLAAPATVEDKQAVHLGRREGVDDVAGVALSEPGPQVAGTCDGACDTALALVPLPGDLGEQRSRGFVGSGRVGEDAMNRPNAGHDLAEQRGEPGQLVLRVLV
jgi:hypothetical protein